MGVFKYLNKHGFLVNHFENSDAIRRFVVTTLCEGCAGQTKPLSSGQSLFDTSLLKNCSRPYLTNHTIYNHLFIIIANI